MKGIEEVRTVWEGQPEGFPFFLKANTDLFPEIKSEQKKENEKLIQEFFKGLQKKNKLKYKDAEQQAQDLERDFEIFLAQERILELSKWMSPELLGAIKKETRHFIFRVRDFDPELNGSQIWQTLRNYFIYVMIVEMQGETQNAKDTILAYSLLYPYTDNYIDDAGILKQEKENYNRMIACKLRGECAVPHNPLEEKTCCLLDMILYSYQEEEQKKVADVLFELLEAQNDSIKQQEKGMTGEQILEISVRKGSASVLADYLFASSVWREKEEAFYRKFGFLLQLVDDLQDIEEDKKSESHTLMTEAVNQHRLEQCVNHLLWYSWNTISEFEPENPAIRKFVLKNCVGITLLAAAMNPQFFTPEYLKALEPYLPFSLEFLAKQKIQKSRRHLS